VVALDPSSKTSPLPLLETWRVEFGLQFEIWTDTNYMPKSFLKANYSQVPSFIPDSIKDNPHASSWFSHLDKNDIPAALLKINNHRFRQVKFLTACVGHLRRKKIKMMAHIDTDEYIVINPKLRARPLAVNGLAPSVPFSGSILSFLEQMHAHFPKRLSRVCLMMPVLLFGAVEDKKGGSTVIGKSFNNTKFESLRWKYHAAFNDTRNGLQKAIMDVSALSSKDPLVQDRAFSVHMPSNQSCRFYTLYPEWDAVRLNPLTLQHYVGSYERYSARADARRNWQVYQQKASLNDHMDDGWITGWLQSFVETHGLEKVSRILHDYLVTNSTRINQHL
jgi:hypothetical protein